MSGEQIANYRRIVSETVVPVDSANPFSPISESFSSSHGYAFISMGEDKSLNLRFEDNPWYNTLQSSATLTVRGWDPGAGASPETVAYLINRGNVKRIITTAIGPLVSDILQSSGISIRFVPRNTTLEDIVNTLKNLEETNDDEIVPHT